MPRIIVAQEQKHPQYPKLVAELADELRANRSCGQPMIREQHFPKTDVIRSTVIWDKWESLKDEDRLQIILQAYEQVEGEAYRERLVLAVGMTVPEAHAAGLLPVQITAVVRATDPVTVEQCREVILATGASVLAHPERPVLRFATVAEAEQCVQHLVERLPGSEPVWLVTQE